MGSRIAVTDATLSWEVISNVAHARVNGAVMSDMD
jgi:hypothetical protein